MKTSRVIPSLFSIFTVCSQLACSDESQFNGALAPKVAEAFATTPEAEAPSNEQTIDPEKPTSILPPLTARSKTSSGTRPSSSEPLSPEELNALITRCQNTPLQTLVQTITFPENRNCAWNQADNLGRRDRYLQAIEVQAATIKMPEQSQLCGLEIASSATTLHYDDFLVLTLNEAILMSSNQQIIQPLGSTAQRAYEWDFTTIRGNPVDFSSSPYCAGATSCQIPKTDKAGRFQFAIDPTQLETIAAKVVGKDEFDFALIATGDNDDRDCYHTAFSLEFRLQYIATP